MHNYEDMDDEMLTCSDDQLITLVSNGIYIHDILYSTIRKRNRNEKSLELFQRLAKLDYDENTLKELDKLGIKYKIVTE